MVGSESELSSKPHIVVLASPGMGHVIPLFELAKRLVIQHGCQVSFLAITTHSSAAQDRLLHAPDLPSELHVVDLPSADVSTLITDDLPVVSQLCIMVRDSLQPLRSILLQLKRPRALVIDILTTQAFDVCRELNIPVYSFFTSSTALFAFSLYLLTLDREVEGEFVDLPEPIRVPGCTPIRTEDLPDPLRNRKMNQYEWYLFHVSRLPMAAGIFVNTWANLEAVQLRAIKETRFFLDIPTPPVHPIGPLIKETEPATESDEMILRWLDKQPPDTVLFVALGSGGRLTREQLTELAWGLEMSQQRFILVARKPSDAGTSIAYFDAGRVESDPMSYLPEGFKERTEGVGLVVPEWASQVAVLCHVSTGGFLSHCGWNSTLESLAHGVPIIAWPLYAEQRMNATALTEELRVAVRPFATEQIVERKEIERVVRLLMEGEEGKIMRHKTQELKESARKALCNGGSSFEELSRVADDWKSDCKFTDL